MGRGIKSFFGPEAEISYRYGGSFHVKYNPRSMEDNDTLLMAANKRDTTICRNGSLCIYLTPKKTFFVPSWNAMSCIEPKTNDEYYLIKVSRKYFKLYDVAPKQGYMLHSAIWKYLSRLESHKEECSERDIRFINALKREFTFDDLVDRCNAEPTPSEAEVVVTGTLAYELGN